MHVTAVSPVRVQQFFTVGFSAFQLPDCLLPCASAFHPVLMLFLKTLKCTDLILPQALPLPDTDWVSQFIIQHLGLSLEVWVLDCGLWILHSVGFGPCDLSCGLDSGLWTCIRSFCAAL